MCEGVYFMKKISAILLIAFLVTVVFYRLPGTFAAEEQYPGFKVQVGSCTIKTRKNILYGSIKW
jgi:hypothetical protein